MVVNQPTKNSCTAITRGYVDSVTDYRSYDYIRRWEVGEMYLKCPDCGDDIEDKEIDLNNLMLPDIWWLEAIRPEDKEFTLPVSGLTAKVVGGKIHLSGENLAPKVLNMKETE